jgi:hypothetical protein
VIVSDNLCVEGKLVQSQCQCLKLELELELELELIQTQMKQKPILRAEGECACVAQMACAQIKGVWVAKYLTKSEALVGGARSRNT